LKLAAKISAAVAAAFVAAFATQADEDHIRWKSNGAPTEAYITGGPWTLDQSGAANGLKSSGYCDSNGNQIGNPGTQRMQPYYFPVINGRGKHLQGYFDWRPKDTDEAVAAAFSNDAGFTWTTDVSATATRWLATAGTILKLEGSKFGLLFSGGGCIDGDSDAFHYIGYAESRDLLHWTVVNGINNPVVSTAPFTIAADPNGIPATGGSPVTVPANAPVAGNTMGWFFGRVYAPSATLFDHHDITVVFAGYHTPKPKNGLGDYLTIGRVSLHTEREIVAIGQQSDAGEQDVE
jgi:hypothetical protein